MKNEKNASPVSNFLEKTFDFFCLLFSIAYICKGKPILNEIRYSKHDNFGTQTHS